MSTAKCLGLAALAIASIGVAGDSAHAHALGQSYIFLRFEPGYVGGHLEATIDDLETAMGLGLTRGGGITEAELAARADTVVAYVLDRLSVSAGDTPLEIRPSGIQLAEIHGSQYAIMPFTLAGVPDPLETLDLTYDVLFDELEHHRALLVVEHDFRSGTFNNGTGVSLVFTPDDRKKQLDFTSASALRGFAALVVRGARHVAASVETLLLLIVLSLPSVLRRSGGRSSPAPGLAPPLRRLALAVVWLTLAGTVTLVLGISVGLAPPARLVDALLALLVIVAAVDAIVPILGRRIWAIAVAFGLVQGFAAAPALARMAISETFIVLGLVGFVLGMGLARLVVVGILVPLAYALRARAPFARVAVPGTAAAAIAVALYRLAERGLGVDVPAGAIARRVMDLFA